ncbi:MAG: DeoR family transcriptional regulator [Chloroflexi bacterium]|nr:DeoR family transcriptional regulator [Chloroflexota bacterium]
MNVPELLHAREGKTLEFKRDLSSLQPILKTLVAFANTSGGTLVVGVRDDGAAVGIADPLREEERLASSIADSIRPAMTPEIDLASHDGKTLLIVHVPRWRGPFYLRSEGPQDGVYVRLGSTNRRAGPDLLAELQRSLAGVSFDQLPCADLSADDLDPERIRRYCAAIGREVSQAHLESLGVLVRQAGQLAPSHGGLILFGRDAPRQRLFPEARVSCARFRGVERVDFLDRLDIEGTVLEALEETPKFIRRNTRLAARIVTMRRQDIPEYPEVALREVLVNAVAHADYSLTGMRIRIAIYANRLEVENPGMLPFGMTLEDLKAGVSRIRNRVIVRVLRELGLVEEWGTGYRRVTQACEEGGYSPPTWQEMGAALRVIFQPHPAAANEASEQSAVFDVPVNVPDVPVNEPDVPINEAVNERQRWLLVQLSEGQQLKPHDVTAHFGVSEKTAKRDIAGLKARGLIEFVGAPKTGFYRLIRREL